LNVELLFIVKFYIIIQGGVIYDKPRLTIHDGWRLLYICCTYI